MACRPSHGLDEGVLRRWRGRAEDDGVCALSAAAGAPRRVARERKHFRKERICTQREWFCPALGGGGVLLQQWVAPCQE